MSLPPPRRHAYECKHHRFHRCGLQRQREFLNDLTFGFHTRIAEAKRRSGRVPLPKPAVSLDPTPAVRMSSRRPLATQHRIGRDDHLLRPQDWPVSVNANDPL